MDATYNSLGAICTRCVWGGMLVCVGVCVCQYVCVGMLYTCLYAPHSTHNHNTTHHPTQAWQQRSDAQQRIAIETMLPELTAQGAAAFAATSAYLAQRATTCTQGWGGAQMTMGSGGGGGTQAQAGGAFVTQAPWGTHTIATQAPWGGHTISTQAPVYTAATHDDGISGGGGSGGGGGKRKRHPRWLRRRQAKRQAKAAAVVAAAAAAHEDEEEEEMEDDNESKGMVLHREQYDGQHDGQQTKRKRVHASTTTTRTAHTSVFRVPPPPQHPQAAAPPRRAQQHNRPPMPHQPPNKDRPPTAPAPRGSTAATIHSIRQPSKVLLPRWHALYCARAPAKTCLSTHRMCVCLCVLCVVWGLIYAYSPAHMHIHTYSYTHILTHGPAMSCLPTLDHPPLGWFRTHLFFSQHTPVFFMHPHAPLQNLSSIHTHPLSFHTPIPSLFTYRSPCSTPGVPPSCSPPLHLNIQPPIQCALQSQAGPGGDQSGVRVPEGSSSGRRGTALSAAYTAAAGSHDW